MASLTSSAGRTVRDVSRASSRSIPAIRRQQSSRRDLRRGVLQKSGWWGNKLCVHVQKEELGKAHGALPVPVFVSTKRQSNRVRLLAAGGTLDPVGQITCLLRLVAS